MPQVQAMTVQAKDVHAPAAGVRGGGPEALAGRHECDRTGLTLSLSRSGDYSGD